MTAVLVNPVSSSELSFCKSDLERKLVSFPFLFRRQHWIATVESEGAVDTERKNVGRIAANISERDPTRGYIGFYDCDLNSPFGDETAQNLLKTAENWLKGNSVKTIYGPINYSTWFLYRFLTRSTNTIRFGWEPDQPEPYLQQWKDFGFVEDEVYHSKAYADIKSALPKTRDQYQEFQGKGFHTRPMELKTHPDRELLAIGKINQKSFQSSFLSEPLSKEAYQELYVPQFDNYLSEYCFFVLDPRGDEIGYFFVFPDQGYLVWKSGAIIPEYQGIGMASFGIHHVLLLAKDRGLDRMVSALIRKGAPSEVLLQKVYEMMWEHEYTVFKKEI